MKRKPIEIVAGLLNAFNSFEINKDYNINEIRLKTGYHWETIRDYILLINLIQRFSPTIAYSSKLKRLHVLDRSNHAKSYSLEHQLVIYLFTNRMLNKEQSISLKEIIPDVNLIPKREVARIKGSSYMQFINSHGEENVFLTRKGKFKAQGLLASINMKMGEYIDNQGDVQGMGDITLQSLETPVIHVHVGELENNGEIKPSIAQKESKYYRAARKSHIENLNGSRNEEFQSLHEENDWGCTSSITERRFQTCNSQLA